MKKGGKSKRFPDLNKDGKITMADILQGRGVKRQAYGGKVEYGIGGALLGGINALRAGKGLGGAAMAAGKGFITPGSGIAQGAKMAGGLLARSNNPALAKLGGLAGAASSFLPGGGGPMSALAGLPGLLGGRSADMGMKVTKKSVGEGEGVNTTGLPEDLLFGKRETFVDSEGEVVGKQLLPSKLRRMLGGADVKASFESGGASNPGNPEESNPPIPDFLLRRDVDDMNELQQSRSDRGSAFGTASTDVFMPTGNIPSMTSSEMEAPEDMQEIESRGPRLLRKDPERGLVGGMKDIPEASKEDSSFRGIYYNPTTSNIRAHIPTDDESFDGERTFGARGFEEEDRIPYGFIEDGKKIFATTAALDKMKEQGVGARGAAAEDYIMELYRSNPELFTSTPQGGQKSRAQMFQRVMEEAKTRKPGVPGFYIPTSPLKASF